MRSLDLSSCCVRIPSTPTCGSDVYMYGALVHEIIAETPLFGTLGPHELIYAVACGRKHPTANLQTSTIIKVSKTYKTFSEHIRKISSKSEQIFFLIDTFC